MAQDYFAMLGLTPGRRDLQEVTDHFLSRRERLLAELGDPRRHAESRRRLEELHLAYAVLRDPRRQAEYLRTRDVDGDAVGELRALIAAALEDGLLRHSRRRAILARAVELGLSEFQAHLLIAQVQFGEQDITPVLRPARMSKSRPEERAWARVAGAGVLALALFLYLVRWLGV